MVQSSSRRAARGASALIACAAAVSLAACSSSGSGVLSGSPAQVVSTAPAAAPSTSAAPVTSAVPITSAAPASTPAGSGAPGASGCVAGAKFCDEFTSHDSGWAAENTANYFAGYDPYLGGTYRMGERTDAALTEDAPFDVVDAAPDYSVQVDVDATPGSTFPSGGFLGVDCWEHAVKDGGGATSAFLLQISGSEALIGLWDDLTGKFHQIAARPAAGVLKSGATNHLTAQCLQGTDAGGAAAQLSLTVNGTKVVSATYARSTKNWEWQVGNKVGLLAVGQGSDVFYDNFAITAA